MTRKCKTLITVFLVIICLSLAACGQKNPTSGEQAGTTVSGQTASEKTSSSKSLPDKLSKKEVSVLVWTDAIQAEFDDAVKIMDEKYGAKVSFTMVDTAQMETKIIAAMNSGSPFDCVYWSQENMPRYAVKGLLQPIDPYFDLSEPIWQDAINSMDQFKYKGKYYGVSAGAEALYLYFNKTMFENNGKKTPLEYYNEGKWNWEAFRSFGKDLTQDTNNDGVVDQWGFSIASTEAYEFILSNGADFVKLQEDGGIQLTANDPKIIEALQFYQDGYIKDKYIGVGVKWQTDFPAGKVAMVGAKLAGVNRFAEANMKYEWDMAPFPTGPSGNQNVSPGTCGYWGLGNGAKNPEGGAALLYLHRKPLELKAMLDRCTEAQKELIYKLRKNVALAKYPGIGNVEKIVNSLWSKVSNGTPVTTVIEEQIPVMQAEIDLMMQDMK